MSGHVLRRWAVSKTLRHDERIEVRSEPLIAAAPDLLDALREQVEEFDKRLAEYRASGDHHVALIAEQHHGKRMARARAAIAKAEGAS